MRRNPGHKGRLPLAAVAGWQSRRESWTLRSLALHFPAHPVRSRTTRTSCATFDYVTAVGPDMSTNPQQQQIASSDDSLNGKRFLVVFGKPSFSLRSFSLVRHVGTCSTWLRARRISAVAQPAQTCVSLVSVHHQVLLVVVRRTETIETWLTNSTKQKKL